MEDKKMDTGEEGEIGKIDESLYSRQLYVLGHEAQQRIAGAKIFIAGLKGLGIEIAKNIILVGVKSVAIWDEGVAEIEDLGTQFYLNDKDVKKGRKRSESSHSNLSELNEYVSVNVHHSDHLEKDFFKNFDVAIFTNENILVEDIKKYNEWCNESGTKFIWAQTRGVFGFIFNDFGDTFKVKDQTGEDPKEGMISAIEVKEGVIHALEGKRIDLQDGDFVKFKEIEGMEKLNNTLPWRIEMITPFSFAVLEEKEKKDTYGRVDLSQYGEYKDKGYYTQVKQPKDLNFIRLEEALSNFDKAGTLECCFMTDQEKQKHAAFKALWKFEQNNHGKKPRPHNTEDAMKIIEIAKEQNKDDLSLVNEELIKILSFVASTEISCVCAFIGALVSQEALKAVSQKYTPIKQWYFFDDAKKALPTSFLEMAEEKFKVGEASRYSHQISCFGIELQERIRSLSYFLVGCGAIGCEMIKNFAMMGVGTLGKGKIVTTDMDNIEKSNLNRQFLFRPKDIDRPKSETSAEVAKKINPDLNIEWHTLRVGGEGESERIFGDFFFDSLDGVCNALDNVQARLYMDERCVYYRKPLLDSGTLGTKGNVQVVVPNLTESYGQSVDPPETSIPQCILHHFPSNIEHTIALARDKFEGIFNQQAETVNAYLSDSKMYFEKLKQQPHAVQLEALETILLCLTEDKCITFDQCVQWSRIQFEKIFNHNIKQLLYLFPPEMLTKDGAPFWSGPKRCPVPLIFDINDELHLEFITSASKLRAVNYGLNIENMNDLEYFKKICEKSDVPEWTPKKGMIIKLDEEKKKENDIEEEKDEKEDKEENNNLGDIDEVEINTIMQKLPPPSSLVGYRMTPIIFEKDDPTNHHIDFISTFANLRANNYKIANASKHKIKGIAGKIIPAMVTTTAAVTGLVSIELIKLAQEDKKKNLEIFSNSFLNLALPYIGFSDPMAAPKTEITKEWNWTVWDRFDVVGPMTLAQFLKYFETKYNLEVTMASAGVSLVYSSFMQPEKMKERLNKEVSSILEEIQQKPLPNWQKYIVIEIIADLIDSDEDIEVPSVRYQFRN